MADDVDHFAVLGVTSAASEAEIKKAYRQKALQLHPDKNRDVDPTVGADRFHALILSYEILTDPVARAAAVKKAQDDNARKERQGVWEGKRKAMAEELDRREEEDRKRRKGEAAQKRDEEQLLKKLKEEGRKRREARQAEEDEAVTEPVRPLGQSGTESIPRGQEDPEPQLGETLQDIRHSHETATDASPCAGPLDLTARLRFPASQLDHLSAPRKRTLTVSGTATQTALAEALSARFGPLEALRFTPLKSKDVVKLQSGRECEATALATFRTLDAAYAAVLAGNEMRMGSGVLEDVWAAWASAPKSSKCHTGGSMNGSSDSALPGEPARVSWLRRKGLLGSHHTDPPTQSSTTAAPLLPVTEDILPSRRRVTATLPPQFSFAPSTFQPRSDAGNAHTDHESATLMRLRQAERRRLEDDIRRREFSDL